MINFRYHIISIAAIFLALAAGIALGSGPLDNAKNIIGDNSNSSSSVDHSDLASFDAAYAKKTGTAMVKGKLKGQSVVIFTLPGARADEVKGLKSAMASGGASVTGEVALTSKLLDSGGRQFAEGVSSQAAKGASGVVTVGDSYVRIGSALGRAFLAKSTTKADAPANTIASAFVEGKLINETTRPADRASIALIVAGPDKADGDLGGGNIAAQLALAFDSQAKGVVFAGPSQSSQDGGYVQILRAGDTSSQVSSIDVSDSAAGRLIAVLVAAREIADNAGAFGTARSADGAIPN